MIRIAAATIAALAFCTAASTQPRVSYFPVPQGAHPHDVAAAPDGTVWYTAQHQGALGILDPKTGKVEQVPLGKGAAPHGVIERNRARRSENQSGEAVPAAEGVREGQP
jgi:virginiamycin B lyase